MTSQRLVDVILGAFNACAASQGCMNNITFGDESQGYYETVAGGAGAVRKIYLKISNQGANFFVYFSGTRLAWTKWYSYSYDQHANYRSRNFRISVFLDLKEMIGNKI